MRAKKEQSQAIDSNPVLSIGKDGTVIYSNEAGEPLLNEWGVEVGERLPSYIGDIIQRVISSNSPEKMEVKMGKKVYLVVFHPSPEQECVNISGFDISDHIKLEGELQESEARETTNLELVDIIDAPAIQSLMDNFYKLAHIPMSLDDLKGNVLVGVGWQDICTKFHRVHPETCKYCMESDTKLSAAVSPGEFKLYKCKNNMWDIATPIIVSGQHVGNIFSGQFFFEDEPLDYELFRSQARKYSFNEEEYIAALEKVPRLSREEVNTGMAFFITFANMISQLGYSNLKLAQSLAERESLVDALRESSERLRQAQQVARIGTFEWNIQTGVNTWTSELEAMYGRPLGGFLGTEEAWELFLYPEDRPEIIRQVNDAIEKGIFEGEWRVVWPDGSIHWLYGRAFVFKNESGKPLKLIGINIDITERKQEEHRIHRYNHILEGINCIFSNVVQAKTEEELGEACLSVAIKVTGSEFGFIIEMGADGLLHDVAKSKLAWEQCHMYDKTGNLSLPHDYVVHGLYGSVIIHEKSFFTNDPQSHPDSKGLPEGHPPITSFLCVPLILYGKTIGSIAVANREGGYNCEQQEDLEAIAPAVTQVLQRRKVEQERRLAEQELKASELRFKALVQDLESGVFLIDGEGKFTIYNPAFLQIFSVSEQELEHMKIQDFSWDTWNVVDKDGNALHFESHPVQYARINRKPVKNQVIGIRRYSHEDWVWTLASAEPLLNPDGSINIIICTFTDITQLKNAEDALKIANETLEEKVKERTVELEKAYSTLKEKEELLSDAQEMAHIGNWEQNFVTGKLHWSDEMYRIFGLKPQEFKVNYGLFLSHLHPDDQYHVDNAVKGALSGKPFSIGHRIILANGEERIAYSKGDTVFDKENNPVRFRGTTQDITDLRTVEERIKTLANIVESSLDAIGTLSLEGNITSWNKGAEQIYGYSTEEILGKLHPLWLHPIWIKKQKN